MQNYLLIAGTGRSGTSFLVRYLTELGLDTHLSRHGANAFWDEAAHAGLEEPPVFGEGASLPYVVKSPYAYQFIDSLLARDDVTIDGVIIPVRDVVEAASSRSLVEMQKLHRTAPWISELDDTWEQWAMTPGGVVYSLNAMDQARLLALGFHHLVERLTKADIKICFLHFPKIITDADYLFRQLKNFLPDQVTLESARDAHERLANRDNVRVGSELKNSETAPSQMLSVPIKYPTVDETSAIALRRENRRLTDELENLSAARKEADIKSKLIESELGQLAGYQSAYTTLKKIHDQKLQEIAARESEFSHQENAASAHINSLAQQLAGYKSEHEKLMTIHERSLHESAAREHNLCGELALERSCMEDAQRNLAHAEAELQMARQSLARIELSKSWRMTAPIRTFRRSLRSAFR